MLSVLGCIVFEHNPLFLAFALGILVIGAAITIRLFSKVRRSKGYLKFLWLALSGMIAGGTVWSTHFVSMVAYDSNLILGYDLGLTALSMLVMILGAMLGMFLASATHRSVLIELGGVVFGASIVAMHFIGIYAMKLSGAMTHSTPYVTVSVILACLFGMLITSRVARPVTQYCKHLAVLAFILAVLSMHFVAMTGLHIMPLQLDLDTTDLISNKFIGIAVIFTMSVLLISALVTHSIDVATAEVNETRVNHITHHDPLTGLPNRIGFNLHLENELTRLATDNARIAVISLNVSRFKNVNEALGHAGGDAMLRHIAKTISKNLSSDEFVARGAGDEFYIISKPIYQTTYIHDLCQRVQGLVSEPMTWQNEAVNVRCSIGFSVYPDDAKNPLKLAQAAERAMHRARKKSAKSALRYDADRDKQTRERSVLAMDLTRAIRNGEFELQYQLQNDANTRMVTGAEVLLRWRHPLRGMISPGEFIPIAEENNKIQDIGAWVIQSACNEAATWSSPVKIAVNVAPVQLADSALLEVVATALQESGLSPERLELEITESSIIADTSNALQVLLQLKKLGVRIVMDDFGTGYSSLATLQAFPFDKIKIDRDFVQHIGDNKQSAAIVKSTIILSESLGIPVLAEGVDTEDSLTILKSLGCNEVQGYLFGKPMIAAKVRQIMSEIPKGAQRETASVSRPHSSDVASAEGTAIEHHIA